MKRSLSESDSDCDDVFDDNLKAGSPSQSCQISDRKRRRGVIEKRRRDRINCSLSELRRLVPSAFEKQGSAKLEKAEILQMTVDHLKLLHQKGLNTYNYDPHTVARDYRYVGFKECASEVARYLVAVEGLDLQDPLRMRLLSHLQCYSAQREATAKVSLQSGPAAAWSSASPSFNPQYNCMMPSAVAMGGTGSGALGTGPLGSGALGSGGLGSGPLQPQSANDVLTSNSSSSLLNVFSDVRCLGSDGNSSSSGGVGGGLGAGLGSLPPPTPHHPHHQLRSGPAGASAMSSNSSSLSTSVSGNVAQASSMSPPLLHSLSSFHHPHHQFASQSLGGIQSSHSSAYAQHPSSAAAVQGSGFSLQQATSAKPYRPWGGELAY